MPALPSSLESIDALIEDDPRALDDGGLKRSLLQFAAARAALDAAEAATIAEFDARSCFVLDGMANTRSWLAHQTGVAREIAGARLNLARHLRRMPLTAQALAEGRITAGHAVTMSRCLKPRTRAAFDRDEALLVAAAADVEATDFFAVVAEWIRVNDQDGAEPNAPEPSELKVSTHFEGRVKTDGDFNAEDGAEYRAELEEIYDELWHEDQAAYDDDPDKGRSVSQRYAAAQVEMARRSSAMRSSDPDNDDATQRPRRPLLIAVVDYDAVEDRLTNLRLSDGTRLGQTTLDRWACDSGVARVVMQGSSEVLDLGSTTYTPSPSMRRALIARDGGCIVPGCKRTPKMCQAHHVVSWPTGPTNLQNLVLLCCRHHKHLHAGIIKLVRDDPKGRWKVLTKSGAEVLVRPPPRLAA